MFLPSIGSAWCDLDSLNSDVASSAECVRFAARISDTGADGIRGCGSLEMVVMSAFPPLLLLLPPLAACAVESAPVSDISF